MRHDPLGKVCGVLEARGMLAPEQERAVRSAYAIAEVAHAGYLRMSGDPYISHPLAVAEIAAGWSFPFALVLAALLHDVPDSGLSLDCLQGHVDESSIAIVRALYDLKPGLDLSVFRSARPLANHGRLTPESIAACAIALKVADRLHNARTWEHVPPERARLKAQEAIDLIAPAAAAASLTGARDELLSLSFSQLKQQRVRSLRADQAGRRSHTSGERLAQSLLHRALDSLPDNLRHRYAEEWPADLATLTGARERIVFALGLQYSARHLTRNR